MRFLLVAWQNRAGFALVAAADAVNRKAQCTATKTADARLGIAGSKRLHSVDHSNVVSSTRWTAALPAHNNHHHQCHYTGQPALASTSD